MYVKLINIYFLWLPITIKCKIFRKLFKQKLVKKTSNLKNEPGIVEKNVILINTGVTVIPSFPKNISVKYSYLIYTKLNIYIYILSFYLMKSKKKIEYQMYNNLDLIAPFKKSRIFTIAKINKNKILKYSKDQHKY